MGDSASIARSRSESSSHERVFREGRGVGNIALGMIAWIS